MTYLEDLWEKRDDWGTSVEDAANWLSDDGKHGDTAKYRLVARKLIKPQRIREGIEQATLNDIPSLSSNIDGIELEVTDLKEDLRIQLEDKNIDLAVDAQDLEVLNDIKISSSNRNAKEAALVNMVNPLITRSQKDKNELENLIDTISGLDLPLSDKSDLISRAREKLSKLSNE